MMGFRIRAFNNELERPMGFIKTLQSILAAVSKTGLVLLRHHDLSQRYNACREVMKMSGRRSFCKTHLLPSGGVSFKQEDCQTGGGR
jgi:hypothetical protein